MNTIRAFVRNVLNEGGDITAVPGGISTQLKRYITVNPGAELDEESKQGLASANAMLAASRTSIIADVASAIENYSIEVGTAFNDDDLLYLAKAMVELLQKDYDAATADSKSYNYPYRAGLYVVAWQNGWVDPPTWIEEWFKDFLGRVRPGVTALAGDMKSAAGTASAVGSEVADDVSDTVTGTIQDVEDAVGEIREGLTLFGGSALAGHLLAELIWPIIRKRASGLTIRITKWMLNDANKQVWIDTFNRLAAGESDKGWLSYLARAGVDKLNYIFTGRDIGEMRRGAKISMDAFALLNKLTPDLKTAMGRDAGDFLDGTSRNSFLEETRKATLNRLEQGADAIPTGTLAKDLLDAPPNIIIQDSDFANITAIVNAYRATKDNQGDKFTIVLNLPMPGSRVRVPTTLEILKTDGAQFDTFLTKYSEGVEKVVNVYGKLKLGSMGLHMGLQSGIFLLVHWLADKIYNTTFIGFDHLPLNVDNDTLAAIFTAAAIREAIYTASNDVHEEIDYAGLDELSKANSNFVELTKRDLSMPCTAEEILAVKIMYEAAVTKLELL